MNKQFILLVTGFIFIGGAFYAWPSLLKNNTANVSDINNEFGGENKITVFKSPTCGCCGEYISYLKREGFDVKVENTNDMLSVKEKYQVSSDIESCHTSVVGNYFIEGHVPIEAIKKLLTEKPDILGIALPGMPMGAPGMDGNKTGEFKIYGISKGEITEFTTF